MLHEAESEIGDDSEEGGFTAFNDAPTGRESLERSIRQRIAGRAEEGQRDSAAGKRIEGKAMASRLKRKALSPVERRA